MAKAKVKPRIDERTAIRELARRKAISHLIPFTELTFAGYRKSWHHVQIAHALEGIERGEILRLMIFEPPRHGKSELVSIRFPAWYLGRNPVRNFLHASYNDELATDFGRKVRNLTAEPVYQELFPDARMSEDSTAAGRWNTKKGGAYFAAGVGGSFSGKGGNVLNIDDPFKNREQAESKVYRNRVWNWYTDDAVPRLAGDIPGPRGAVILTMTRWHKDDLAGRILQRAKESGEKWVVLSMPAIAEADEELRKEGIALWPEAFPCERLTSIKGTIGTRAWNAEYQQRPTDEEGGIIKRPWFRYFTDIPSRIDGWLQSWDMSFKETDDGSYVTCGIWAWSGANRYLVDQVRKRMDFVETIRKFNETSEKYPQATAKLVENKANGPAVVSALKNKIYGIIEIEPDGSKTSRASAIAPLIEAGNVFLPDPRLQPWVEAFVDECADFPNGVNDDQVDQMTQALNWMKNHGAGFQESHVMIGPQSTVMEAW